MITFMNWFVKITGWLPQRVIFNMSITYEDKKVQSRFIKGPAIIVCNHTSVWDYAALMFVFLYRTLRCQMAEVLFKKPLLGKFLKIMGGIYVDRHEMSSGFLGESGRILKEGGVVEIFPESRIPLKDEEKPLPFKPSAALIALRSEVPVIPVYTNGCYFTAKRAKIVIGKPINVHSLVDPEKTDRENVMMISELLRTRVKELGERVK